MTRGYGNELMIMFLGPLRFRILTLFFALPLLMCLSTLELNVPLGLKPTQACSPSTTMLVVRRLPSFEMKRRVPENPRGWLTPDWGFRILMVSISSTPRFPNRWSRANMGFGWLSIGEFGPDHDFRDAVTYPGVCTHQINIVVPFPIVHTASHLRPAACQPCTSSSFGYRGGIHSVRAFR